MASSYVSPHQNGTRRVGVNISFRCCCFLFSSSSSMFRTEMIWGASMNSGRETTPEKTPLSRTLTSSRRSRAISLSSASAASRWVWVNKLFPGHLFTFLALENRRVRVRQRCPVPLQHTHVHTEEQTISCPCVRPKPKRQAVVRGVCYKPLIHCLLGRLASRWMLSSGVAYSLLVWAAVVFRTPRGRRWQTP